MTKLWLAAVTAIVTAATVASAGAYADSMTSLQDLQAKTDQLIKVAQADMKNWQKPVVTASNKQALITMNGKPVAGAKPVKKSTTAKAAAQSKRRPPPRGTRTVPSVNWHKTKPKPKTTS